MTVTESHWNADRNVNRDNCESNVPIHSDKSPDLNSMIVFYFLTSIHIYFAQSHKVSSQTDPFFDPHVQYQCKGTTAWRDCKSDL